MRCGWCVFAAGFAPEPDEPVLASTTTRPFSAPDAASGPSPSSVAVAKQPGFADQPRLSYLLRGSNSVRP